MNLFAGAYYFDFRPVTIEEQRYAQAVADGLPVEVHTAPGLVMVQDAGSGYATSPRGDTCTFDGRIDQGDEAGGELALALYEKTGIRGFYDLIGDWSLAIWDAQNRAVLLASDFAGIRPLYYQRSAASLKWSSSLEHLASWAGTPDLDLQYVADLVARSRSKGRTPYRGIQFVAPGTVIRFSPDRSDTTRFWQPPTDGAVRYRQEDEYAERLRCLFQEAVAARLKDPHGVCAELSGGLDSSSIVCMADRLAAGTRRMTTFTYYTPGTNDDGFIRAVEDSCAIRPVHLDGDEHPPLSSMCAGGWAPHWGAPRWLEVSRRMRDTGAKVLLTGQLGDLVMGNWLDDAEQAADYLRQGQLVRAVEESFAWSQSLQEPVYPILWRALRPNGPLSGSTPNNHLESLTPTFRKQAQARTDEGGWECPSGVLPSQRKRLLALMDLLESRALQSPDTLRGASLAHPYAHRPLVEFMLGVPAAVTCRPGEPRRLMRRALRGLVPDPVLRRRSKGNYEGMFLRALRPCAAELLQNPGAMQLVELGCIERQSIEGRLRKLVEGMPCNEGQLRQIILLEIWLRQRGRQAGSIGRGHPSIVRNSSLRVAVKPACAAQVGFPSAVSLAEGDVAC
jgi:asparagine synthase (glutamine-hydrolysing)